MKKNGEYVGVDEKFIPEDEKYVDGKVVENKEKSKENAKKILKIGIGAFVGYFVFILVIIICISFFVIKGFASGAKNFIDVKKDVEETQEIGKEKINEIEQQVQQTTIDVEENQQQYKQQYENTVEQYKQQYEQQYENTVEEYNKVRNTIESMKNDF